MLPAVRPPPRLHKLSPEMLAQAHDQTAASITRIILTLVGVSLFCALSLLAPDASILMGNERLFDLPLAGPVSFRGFLVVGPLIIIALRVYLQIYAEHWQRLEDIRGKLPRAIRPPTLAPMRNVLLRWSVWFALYPLVPLTMAWFTWRAAVLPAWGSGLACVTAAVTAGHVVLWLRSQWTWPARAALMVEVAIFAAVIVYSEGPLRRSADLFRADLSYQWLPRIDLGGANLQRASLRGANLNGANLRGADLADADLTYADLTDADVSFANLVRADLEGRVLRKLEGASLTSANLKDADLSGANLRGADLESADLTDAFLLEANLRGANLTLAILTHADLEEADLRFANLRGAKLEDAFLHGAGLSDADLSEAKLKGADLSEAGGTNIKLKDADLTDANLQDAYLWQAIGLTREQLKGARCNEETVLPLGLKPEKDCGRWYSSAIEDERERQG